MQAMSGHPAPTVRCQDFRGPAARRALGEVPSKWTLVAGFRPRRYVAKLILDARFRLPRSFKVLPRQPSAHGAVAWVWVDGSCFPARLRGLLLARPTGCGSRSDSPGLHGGGVCPPAIH